MKRKALTAAALAFTLTLTGCPAPDEEVQTVTCLAEEETSAWSETIENASDFVLAAATDMQDTDIGIEIRELILKSAWVCSRNFLWRTVRMK